LKKLLIISYYWPPAGGPGVQRWVKFSKYLTRMGYSCYVITVYEKHASYPSLDPSLQKDVSSEVHITKTKSFEALKIFSSLFKKEKVPYAGIPDKKKMSIVGKLALYIRSNFFIPDARKGWNKYALEAAKKIIEEEKIDVIITTSPPHSTQLVGLALHKRFPNIKWLADLRDPWTDIYYYNKLSHTKAAREKDLALEKEVLSEADIVTTVSADIKRIFESKSTTISSGKIHVLANGFDEEDFIGGAPAGNEVFTVAHTGTINSNYNISGFMQALELFSAGRKLNLRFIGNVDAVITKEVLATFPNTNFVSYVSHAEAVQYMRMADLLLLAIPDNKDNKGILTGKLFEYLASQKPVICLGPPDGDAAAILAECKAGKTFAYSDFRNMLSYMEETYDDWRQHKTTLLNSAIFKKYSRSELSKQLALLLDQKSGR
jgi:glycosyltransferase involved in cell wall biosynthesis